MKKIIVTIFATALINASFGQFNKGRMLAGGSVGYSSITEKSTLNGTSSTSTTNTKLTFSPNFGYFIIDKLAVGGNIAYSFSNEKGDGSISGNINSISIKTTSFTFNPFVRYYFGPGVFGQGTFGFGSEKDEITFMSTPSTTKYTVGQWSLGIGYALFLNDHVAIEPIFGYQSQTNKSDSSFNPKNEYSGLALSIGIQAYLGERNK